MSMFRIIKLVDIVTFLNIFSTAGWSIRHSGGCDRVKQLNVREPAEKCGAAVLAKELPYFLE